MQAAIQFIDEVFGAGARQRKTTGPRLRVVSSSIAVRDLIAERVRAERATRLQQKDVTPATRDELAQLLWSPVESHRKRTEEQDIQIALDGFRDRSFLLFWNDIQVEDLDQLVPVLEENEALFLKIMPLQGG